MRLSLVALVGSLVLACSGSGEPSFEHHAAPAPLRPAERAPAEELPAAWRLPMGWRWLTETRVGFTAAFPALPIIEPNALGGQRVVVHGEHSEHAIGVTEGDEAPHFEEEIGAQGWTIEMQRELSSGVRAYDATDGRLEMHARLVVSGARTFVVTSTSVIDEDMQAATFLDSFTPSGVLEPRTIRHAQGRFVVDVPARVSEWEETSEEPPLRGLAGLIDGVQLVAAYADVPGATDAALDTMLSASLGPLGGETLSESRDPIDGHASIRVEHRGEHGVRVTRRVARSDSRVYDVAVYAPNGREPAWADAFVDSLRIE